MICSIAIDIEPPRSPPTVTASCHFKRGSGPVSARDAKLSRNTPALFERDAITRYRSPRRAFAVSSNGSSHRHRLRIRIPANKRPRMESAAHRKIANDLPYPLPRIDHRIGADAGVANKDRNTRAVFSRNGIDRAAPSHRSRSHCNAATATAMQSCNVLNLRTDSRPRSRCGKNTTAKI